MDSYHRFSSDRLAAGERYGDEDVARLDHPLLSALPPSTSSVTIAALLVQGLEDHAHRAVDGDGQALLLAGGDLAVRGGERGVGLLVLQSAVVVLLPPNMPPNIARGVVAMGSRAVI